MSVTSKYFTFHPPARFVFLLRKFLFVAVGGVGKTKEMED